MLAVNGQLSVEPFDDYEGHCADDNQHDNRKHATVFYQCRHLLDDQKLNEERNDGDEQPDDQNYAATDVRVGGIRQADVGTQNIHREIAETREHRDQRAPTKIPKRREQQIRIHLLLGIGIQLLLQRHIDQIEEVKQTNPRDARDKVQPTQNDVRDFSGARRLKNAVEHSQDEADMMRRFDEHRFLPN